MKAFINGNTEYIPALQCVREPVRKSRRRRKAVARSQNQLLGDPGYLTLKGTALLQIQYRTGTPPIIPV